MSFLWVDCNLILFFVNPFSSVILMAVFTFQVCFKDVMFPLLPRMRGGLYFNSYVVSVCTIILYVTQHEKARIHMFIL